ncbi:hypothetical protein TNCV_763311 [Trichonephila clavipes]|nr:hypothetical protein TNCV_763311 [Trichonephila clavipes]
MIIVLDHTHSACLPIGRLGRALKDPDKLDSTRFSGYKFRSASAKGSFTPRRTNVECLANQRLHFARDEVSDWLEA